MSLRDYFAGQALIALINISDKYNSITRDEIVSEAYNYADSLLKAREVTDEG